MSKKSSAKPASKSRKTAAAKKTSKPAAKSPKAKKAADKSSKGKKAAAKSPRAKKPAAKTVTRKTSPPAKKAARPVKKARPELISAIIEGLEEKKAKNITVLDLTRIAGRAFDYFVIADADSGTHVESIAGSVEEVVKKKAHERPYHTEGWQNAEWILLDYISAIVHVFQRPVREFYNLEGLWADAEVQKIN
jgi:ribosome-associated protein